VRKSTKAVLKGDAEEDLRRRLVARDAGRPTAAPLTLEQLGQLVLDRMLADGRRSIDRVTRSLEPLYGFLGSDTQARKIDEATVTAYVAWRRAGGVAAATINRELATLRRGFRLAVRAKRLDSRPEFSLLAEHNARQGFFERPQLDAVLVHLPDDLRPVVLAAYVTGWRVKSELLTRQWRHVDMDAGWLRLEPGEGKTREGRMFPFTAELRKLLKEQRARTTVLEQTTRSVIPWVFHRDGKAIRSFYGAWRKACKAAGVPGRLLHDFRRTAVRNMERAAVPRSSAMAAIGHKTEAVYRRYAIVDESTLREAAAKLDGTGGVYAGPTQRVAPRRGARTRGARKKP
jgi:integrase